jgi:UDP-N-acetylglucosamine--N-acetylmuramyl-(pentapeptide) pyrophosphoryl-undecaprenol N-acetylglucosamine transferase
MGKTILIASGGTGGHLYPTIAIADVIKRERPDIEVVFIGTRDRIESREVPRAGYPFEPIDIQAPRKTMRSLLSFPLVLRKAVSDSLRVIRKRKPSVMLGGGAYLSLPVGIAARLHGVPIGLLEINSIGGKANKFLSRMAERLFLAYPESKKDFPRMPTSRVTISGTPVREDLGQTLESKQEARQFFGLVPEQKTLFVFGGSLGARAINDAMKSLVAKFAEAHVNVLWQVGKGNDAEALQESFKHLSGITIREYVYEMEKAYGAADLVVSRAGASSLAELARLGKPVILVPYPFAAENHQEENARAYEAAGAATVLRDSELSEKLWDVATELLADDARRAEMSQAMHKRDDPDAAKCVADWLIAKCG